MGIRCEKWDMRSEEWGISIADQSYPLSTELSEQKVQGHVPGQGQGVKPLVGTGQSPVGVWGRASIGVSLPSGADKEIKAHKSKRNNKAVSENKSLHRFFYPNKQSKTRKERSDFAAEQTIPKLCRCVRECVIIYTLWCPISGTSWAPSPTWFVKT